MNDVVFYCNLQIHSQKMPTPPYSTNMSGSSPKTTPHLLRGLNAKGVNSYKISVISDTPHTQGEDIIQQTGLMVQTRVLKTDANSEPKMDTVDVYTNKLFLKTLSLGVYR